MTQNERFEILSRDSRRLAEIARQSHLLTPSDQSKRRVERAEAVERAAEALIRAWRGQG